MTFYPLCRNFAQMEGGKLMARGLYKNLVTHLVMMEGEGLIETEDIAVAVVEAQEAAVKKGFKLYQHIADKALVGRGKATLEDASLSLMNASDNLLSTPVKMQKEGEGRKEKVRGKQEERAKPSEVGKKKEAEVREGKEEEEVVLLQVESDAAPDLSGRGDEKEKKRKRRSGVAKEEWLVRINNKMEENEKKKEKKDEWMVRINNRMEENERNKEEGLMETDQKGDEGVEDSSSSSFLSLSSSSTDSMPVLSDQSKEGPCLLLSSPPVLDVRNFIKDRHWKYCQNYFKLHILVISLISKNFFR